MRITHRLVRTLASGLVLALLLPAAAAAQERAARLDWETGAGKSYVIPAAEILAFIAGLNLFNRNFIDGKKYDSDGESIRRNLRTVPEFDKDPFSVNQLGHPYQGGIYYGAARSAGLSYGESLLRLIVGERAMFEVAGRHYHVLGTGGGGGTSATSAGTERIERANVAATVRVHGPHALSLQYVVSSREAGSFSRAGERKQSVETITIAYNFLGHTRFGAVEWRPEERR